MINLKTSFFTIVLLILFYSSKADKGMWLLSLISENIEEMKAMGCELNLEEIYNPSQPSIKDAVVGLGFENNPFSHFCTAEIISNQGLLLTNHHCVLGLLQPHATPKNNLLKNGFWAKNKNDELINPGVTASVLVYMEDVTDKILSNIHNDMDEKKRHDAILEISKQIEDLATKGTHYVSKVKSMFYDNRYFLFVHEIFKDVRIVGVPPSFIGKFGGQTDNWEWPRHTADFAILRIYTAPDGTPATYAEENIPLKPKYFFPISIKGTKEKDFALILGFPGSTNRFLTSYGIDKVTNITNTNRYNIRTKKLNVLKEQMKKSDKIHIKYASKYSRSANYWKHAKAQNKALKKLEIKKSKEAQEKQFTDWVNKNDERKAKYGDVLEKISLIYKNHCKSDNIHSYITEALYHGPDLPYFASKGKSLEEALLAKSKKAIHEYNEALKNIGGFFFKSFDKETEKELIAVLFQYFCEHIPKDKHPSIFKRIRRNNFNEFADKIVKKSLFADKKKFDKFIENPKLRTLRKDIGYKTGKSIVEARDKYKTDKTQLNKIMNVYVDGILKMNKNKRIAPDANSTLRLNYGRVLTYTPRDGVIYTYFTTLKGVMEKQDNSTTEFFVDDKLKHLFHQKDYGRYADRDRSMHTCFITNSDITGGNSGSPVLNSKGHLIGVAFDINSEAVSNDIDFEENVQRCINVDIRYVLWIIEKYANASHLIKELKIVE